MNITKNILYTWYRILRTMYAVHCTVNYVEIIIYRLICDNTLHI